MNSILVFKAMHIILIGYRCTGKTSVGRKLAEKLQLPFYDTDQMIIDRIGQTIKTWVEKRGWESFRQEEKTVIKGISSLIPGVIALGGGAVMDPENRRILGQEGVIVWLTADVQTIIERMKSDPDNQENRPPLSDRNWEIEIREMLSQRIPVYEQSTDLSIGTEGKTIEAITEEIINLVKIQVFER